MKLFTRLIVILTGFILFYFILSGVAYAYIDPGFSTYLLQLIIGALIGGAVAIKLFWNKIESFFKGLSSRIKKDKK